MIDRRRTNERPFQVNPKLVEQRANFELSSCDLDIYILMLWLSRQHTSPWNLPEVDDDDALYGVLSNIAHVPEEAIRESINTLWEEGWIEVNNVGNRFETEVTVFTSRQELEEPEFNPDGFVYLAYCSTGHHKIGISVSPEDRISHFDTQMPVEVSEKHRFPASPRAEAEEKLHSQLSEYQHKGEWFELPRHIVDAIKRVNSYNQGCFYHSEGRVYEITSLI